MKFNVDTLSFPLAYPDDTNTGVLHHFHGFSENEEKLSPVLATNFVGLIFNLQQDLRYMAGDSKIGNLPKRQYSLAYIPSGTNELAVEKGKYSVFCIEFTPHYLERIRDHFPVLIEFLHRAEGQDHAVLGDPRPIPPDLFHEIYTIIDKESNRESHALLLGPKYVTVSMDCLKHLGSFGELDSAEVEKVRRAHDYIRKNFRFSCRVGQIADIVEMNSRQLENGFKIVYEKTVYQFLKEERMNKSKALLRDTNMSMKQIAASVGYKNAKTFSHIFKRYFGYPPGELHKKNDE